MLLDIIDFLLMVLTYVIVIQAILSWLVAFNVINTSNEFVRQILYGLSVMTEPFYRPIRRVLPDFGALDFSPLVVLLILQIVRGIVIPHIRVALMTQGMVV